MKINLIVNTYVNFLQLLHGYSIIGNYIIILTKWNDSFVLEAMTSELIEVITRIDRRVHVPANLTAQSYTFLTHAHTATAA